jgi:hypothetical protein
MDGIHYKYNPNNDLVFTPPYKVILELKPSTKTNRCKNQIYLFGD